MIKTFHSDINSMPVLEGNFYSKYDSKYFLERLVVKYFLKRIKEFLSGLECKNILDVGCGEGYITNMVSVLKDCDIVGVDIGAEVIKQAELNYPHITFIQGSACELPFDDNSYDLIIGCELLEHLDNPEKAMKELRRVCAKWVLLSVPREPLWRVLNMMRGRYFSSFGNTPGHLQHWSKAGFINFVKDYFFVRDIGNPIPWTIVLCEAERK